MEEGARFHHPSSPHIVTKLKQLAGKAKIYIQPIQREIDPAPEDVITLPTVVPLHQLVMLVKPCSDLGLAPRLIAHCSFIINKLPNYIDKGIYWRL